MLSLIKFELKKMLKLRILVIIIPVLLCLNAAIIVLEWYMHQPQDEEMQKYAAAYADVYERTHGRITEEKLTFIINARDKYLELSGGMPGGVFNPDALILEV
jgi:hypothetical protein